jgi:hypothetical protein
MSCLSRDVAFDTGLLTADAGRTFPRARTRVRSAERYVLLALEDIEVVRAW